MVPNEIYVTQSSMPPMEDYVDMIKSIWTSRQMTNMGKYHRELESRLCNYLDVEQVSLMVNGHMALEMAIQVMGFPQGSEVITTPFTFISTTHAILRNGLEPVFCDVKDDYTIDEEKIEALITDKTVAIVPVHVYGNVCNVEKIQEIALKYNLKVIYDAAHAFGERYKERGIASFGDCSVFSFHATKVFNTIEGGAVCSSDKDLYEKLYNLKNFGIRSEELVVSVGANAKMNEFAAVMGLCNLKYIDSNIAKRKEIAMLYEKGLEECEGVTLNVYDTDIVPNYSYFPILLPDEETRNRVHDGLKEKGVHTRKYFYPLTADMVCFKNKYKHDRLDKAREMSKRVLILPLYPELEKGIADRIVNMICIMMKESKENGYEV